MHDNNRTSSLPDDAGSPRACLSLDGSWRFRPGPGADWRIIQVPACWESIFPDLRGWSGGAIYERPFTLPPEFEHQRVFLRFDAADYHTEVWVNGKPVGCHEGGYTPFELDITEVIEYSQENRVSLRVTDCPPNTETALPDGSGTLRFADIPHGKQSWYGPVSGVWQSVTLEARSPAALQRLRVTPDVDAGVAHVHIKLAAPLGFASVEIRLQVTAPLGAPPVDTVTQTIAADCDEAELEFAVPRAALWSPETPHLYNITADLFLGPAHLDRVRTRFGMRKIEARDGHVWLNNQPYFLIGALDQAFYPQTIYTPPSVGYLRDQFLKAKEMGLNLARCHLKVPTESYLDMCDEVGLLVWYELPNGQRLSEDFRRRARQTLLEMRERDGNHPCVVIKSIMNEAWGLDCADSEQLAWLAETTEWARELFPAQLIVDNSACAGNLHVTSDMEDYHVYFSIPDHAPHYEAWIRDFARRVQPTYSTEGDARRSGREPLVLSEFGNWGLPRLEGVTAAEGGEPWWFDTGDGATRPRGVLRRFTEQLLGRVYPNYGALADASQEQQWVALKYQIEEMRRYPSIAGYVVTELTDVHWECNGLLDFGRGRKVFHDRLADLQAQDVLIARPERHSYWSGEMVRVAVDLSRFDAAPTEGGQLRWSCGAQSGMLPVGATTCPGASLLGFVSFVAPEPPKPELAELEVVLLRPDGNVRARTQVPLVIAPSTRRRVPEGQTAWVHGRGEAAVALTHRLERLGYRVLPTSSPDALAVMTHWDLAAHEFVMAGGHALFLATDPDSLDGGADGIRVVSRTEEGRWGDWCSSHLWFAPDQFPDLPRPTVFGMEYEKVVPQHVFLGVPAESTLAGLFVGWLHNPAAVAFRAHIGAGLLTATTLNLASQLGDDPVATLLWGRLEERG